MDFCSNILKQAVDAYLEVPLFGNSVHQTLQSVPSTPKSLPSILKKKSSTTINSSQKRHVEFDTVTVSLFKRQQGFLCIPRIGAATLGMEMYDMDQMQFSIDDFEQHLQHYRSNNPDRTYKCKLSTQREEILKEADIDVDKEEEESCNKIRLSRGSVGCNCRMRCDPNSCPCAQNDIPCKIAGKACRCLLCTNPNGCHSYKPIEISRHYNRTFSKLKSRGETVKVQQTFE